MSKKRQVEEKTVEKKSLKRKLVQSSDFETDVEEDLREIVSTIRIQVGGKRIHVNIHVKPLDNVSFHSESSAQRWKYVCQRRVTHANEFSKEAFDSKEIIKLLKVDGLIKIVTDIDPCYEKLVKEFIMNIPPGCIVDGSQKYKKVYVRGKCVMFTPSIVNNYLCKNKPLESDKAPPIENIAKEISGGHVKQ